MKYCHENESKTRSKAMKITRHEIKNMMGESILPKGDCLSEDLLIAFNKGRATEKECEHVIEHLKTCRECTDLWKSYDIFMSETVKKVPEKYKKKTYEKITKPHRHIIMRFLNSPYLAYAATLLLTVSIVFIIYTQFLLRQTDASLAMQNQRLEDLRKNQATSQQQLAALKNDLQNREKEFMQ